VLLATPILVDLKQRDPRIREQARRVAARRARTAAAVAGEAPEPVLADDDELAGELRRERAMAAAAGVPSRTAPRRAARERPTGKNARPTGKRRR
jgi:preprotein translocase subunit SecF